MYQETFFKKNAALNHQLGLIRDWKMNMSLEHQELSKLGKNSYFVLYFTAFFIGGTRFKLYIRQLADA